MTNRLPDFIVIGAMKCGTSTLHDQLAAQPAFFMSDPKEPNFFSDDDHFKRGIEWYQNLFRDAPANAIKGESSTHYTKLPTHPHTVERLVDAAPNARLIYVMRHPVDRLISHYIHEWTQRKISAPIDDAIQDMPGLIDYGRYAFQLAPFINAFGKEKILPVFFERMVSDPNAELMRIRTFLGVEGKLANAAQATQRNVSSERIRKFPLYSLLIDNPALAAARRALIPKSWRDRVKSQFQMRDRPALSTESEEFVTSRFDEDLAELSRWLDASLNCATFKSTVKERAVNWR